MTARPAFALAPAALTGYGACARCQHGDAGGRECAAAVKITVE